MIVGTARIEFHAPGARSLKDKRAIVRSLKDRLRNRCKVSVAEVDHQDLWQRFALGVAVVGTDRRIVDSVLSSVLRICEAERSAYLVDFTVEIL
jgi:uncharacterized protein YlxP (DUF503 family)